MPRANEFFPGIPDFFVALYPCYVAGTAAAAAAAIAAADVAATSPTRMQRLRPWRTYFSHSSQVFVSP